RSRSNKPRRRSGGAVSSQSVGGAPVYKIGKIKCLKPELDALSLANLKGSRYAQINVDGSWRENVVGAAIAVSSERRLREGRGIEVAIRCPVGLIHIRKHLVGSLIRGLP